MKSPWPGTPLGCACLLLLALATPARAAAAVPVITLSNVSLTEGDEGTKSFSVDLQLQWSEPVQVNISAVPGTATPDDYDFYAHIVTVLPGTTSTVTVVGGIKGDRVAEGDEFFTIVVTKVGGGPDDLISNGGRVDIIDDDAPGVSRLAIFPQLVVKEGDDLHDLAVAVTLSPANASTITVAYETVDRTAHAGHDYNATSGTLTFAPGETIQRVKIPIRGDTAWEPAEAFTIKLSQPRGPVVVEWGESNVVLQNDDPPFKLMTLENRRVREGDAGTTAVTLTLRLDRPAPEEAPPVAWLKVYGGSAARGEDYQVDERNLEVAFAPGQSTATFSFDLLGDRTPECDEDIVFSYVLGGSGNESELLVEVMIEDDDGGRAAPGCPAGPSSTDGGAAGAGTTEEPLDAGGGAGPDAADARKGAPAADAPTAPMVSRGDAGTARLSPGAGCSCAAGGGPRSATWAAVALAALAAVVRRRRGGRPPPV